MSDKILIVVIIILTVPIMAQPNWDDNMHSIRISPLSASYTFEKSITKEFKLLSNGTLSIMPVPVFGSWGIITIPRISVEPRYYYNLEERKKKDKSIRNNAADYFAFSVNSFLIYDFFPKVVFLGPKWGIRRNILQKLYFDTNIGCGLFYSPGGKGIYPMGSLEIGWHL